MNQPISQVSIQESSARNERELFIIFPDGTSRAVPLDRPALTLGRSTDNDLGYPEDSGLSRRHLAFEKEEKGWVLRDLGSKNGTFLNGVRIQEKQELKTGDRITASHLQIVFQSPELRVSEVSVVFAPSTSELELNQAVSTSLDKVISSQTLVPKSAAGPSSTSWKAPITAFLRAGRELTLGRPLQELFQVILELSIEAVGAERGVLLTTENGQLVVRASCGDGFRISSTVRDRVIGDKTSLLIRDAQADEAFRSMQSIVSQNVRTLMAAPLQTDTQVLGLIYVDLAHPLREFTIDDLNLLTVMANVAAIRIERERFAEVEHARRRLANELEQAAEIQRQFLPREIPRLAGLELAGYNMPCRTVGGDYYDFVTYPDGQMAIVVGDVCGKGMPAALLMMTLQARFQVLAEQAVSPAQLLERLNRILVQASLNSRFISLFLCMIHPLSGEICYTNAGHNAPLVVRSQGTIEWLESGGPVLGILPEVVYTEESVRVEKGDIAVFYSDGVTEANNPQGEEFGEKRLAEYVQMVRHQSADEILQELTRSLQNWVGDGVAHDDMTLVVVRKT
ncbi:MAG: SpoIIE family protein phosphatase [Terriglobia bacterium]